MCNQSHEYLSTHTYTPPTLHTYTSHLHTPHLHPTPTHTHPLHLQSLLQPIYSKPDQCGDLMFEVAEAYMDAGDYGKALPLLSSLVRTDRFNQAGVWLKHAECHHMMQDMDAAALSYHRVLSLAPRHTDTRLTLATLYSQMGLTEDALALLEVPSDTQEEEEERGGGGEAEGGGVFVPQSQPQFSVSMFARCESTMPLLVRVPY